MNRLLIAVALLVITPVGGCATAQRDTTSLCAYGDQARAILDQLQGRELSGITEYSSPAEVAAYGRSGEQLTTALLTSWHKLNPPLEARLWHESMDEWITTLSGGFAIFTAAGDRPPSEVRQVVGTQLQVMQGMMYEGNQLDMQANRLFSECK